MIILPASVRVACCGKHDKDNEQSHEKDKEHLEEELQWIKDAAETIHDLDKRMEEQAYNT